MKRIKRAGLLFLWFLVSLFAGKVILDAVWYLAGTSYGDYVMLDVGIVALAWVAWWMSGDFDHREQNPR